MFTGIIESLGKIISIDNKGSNKSFWIESDLTPQIKIDESISHDGVCLTIEQMSSANYRVTAIKETIDKTTLANWKSGNIINLERSMLMNGRIDGHMVQGHVDGTANCTNKKELKGSWEFTFCFAKQFAALVIEKGSVCVNGVSLTSFNVRKKKFTVAVIPYTFEHTNFSQIQKDSIVNIEFDLVGKYVNRAIDLKKRLSW